MKHLKQQKGFTLIELLVAITIFVVAVTSASAIFIAVIRSQQKSNIQRQTSQDARYAMEAITREVRMATGSDTEPPIKVENGVLTIVTIDNSGSKTIKTFQLVSDRIILNSTKDGIAQITNQPITSDNLKVSQFDLSNFLLASDYDPTTRVPDRQPSVTITIASRQKNDNPQTSEQSKATLRTTISSRDYLYEQ